MYRIPLLEKLLIQPLRNVCEKLKNRWEELDKTPDWLVPREEWGARAPACTEYEDIVWEPLNTPVAYVVIHDTSNYDDPGTDTEEIKRVLREMQDDDMAEDVKDFCDICYNFMVGADGKVYEGRGWLMEGEHTHLYNDKSIGVALIGNHKGKPPNDAMLAATAQLIQEGVRKHYLTSDVRVVPHSEVLPGARCPTQHLREVVQRGVLAPDPGLGEWAWLWTVKRWLNQLPQSVREYARGQWEFWVDEWKTCSTRQWINYTWNN